MATLTFHLTAAEMAVLLRPVNGSGGFQSFFRRLQAKLDQVTGQIELTDSEMGRIVRGISYRPGGFEQRLHDIFARAIREFMND